MQIDHLTSKTFKPFIEKKGVVLVDFYATWCPPCKMLAPILDEISGDDKLGLPVAKLDIDKEMGIANEYTVMSVPTMIIFKDGVERERIVGFRRKDQILDVVSKIN